MTATTAKGVPAAGRLVCFNTCVYRIGEDGREAQERMARLGEE